MDWKNIGISIRQNCQYDRICSALRENVIRKIRFLADNFECMNSEKNLLRQFIEIVQWLRAIFHLQSFFAES